MFYIFLILLFFYQNYYNYLKQINEKKEEELSNIETNKSFNFVVLLVSSSLYQRKKRTNERVKELAPQIQILINLVKEYDDDENKKKKEIK